MTDKNLNVDLITMSMNILAQQKGRGLLGIRISADETPTVQVTQNGLRQVAPPKEWKWTDLGVLHAGDEILLKWQYRGWFRVNGVLFSTAFTKRDRERILAEIEKGESNERQK